MSAWNPRCQLVGVPGPLWKSSKPFYPNISSFGKTFFLTRHMCVMVSGSHPADISTRIQGVNWLKWLRPSTSITPPGLRFFLQTNILPGSRLYSRMDQFWGRLEVKCELGRVAATHQVVGSLNPVNSRTGHQVLHHSMGHHPIYTYSEPFP